jgi:NAD(P)-dependent dehydrogenase (short-subunit alcohol dehydrogenase family)
MNIEDRVILVTGAAKRVGREIALACARRGARVAVHHRRSAAEARRTVAEIRDVGGRAEAFRADLARAREASALPAAVARRMGRLDAVVASASVYQRTPFDSLDERAWDEQIDVNLKATYLLSIAAARVMKTGAIVTIGDVMGLRPYENLLPYGVSKAGVIFLTRALAQALAPRIRANCVCPGPVLLPERLSARARRAIERTTPLGIGKPEHVAHAVLFLLENEYATGAVVAVDGGRDLVNRVEPHGGA